MKSLRRFARIDFSHNYSLYKGNTCSAAERVTLQMLLYRNQCIGIRERICQRPPLYCCKHQLAVTYAFRQTPYQLDVVYLTGAPCSRDTPACTWLTVNCTEIGVIWGREPSLRLLMLLCCHVVCAIEVGSWGKATEGDVKSHNT